MPCSKGDVILKYTADEARQLKSTGQLPENGASPRGPVCAPLLRRTPLLPLTPLSCPCRPPPTSPLPCPCRPPPVAVVINEGVGGGEDGEDGGFDFDDEGDSSDGDVDIAAI
jgi:hypothetical protein